MMTTVLQSPEYVATARRAGIYAHMLAYINAVERGLDLPPLPGEYAPHQAQSGGTVPHLRVAAQQQQVAVHQAQQRNPVQVLAKKKASEKAMGFFQSSLKVLGIEEEVALTDEILKAAYKKAVIRAHPDRGGSEEHFEAVTRAYAYLTEILHLIQGQKGRSTAPVPELDTVVQQRATQSQQVAHVEPVRLNPKNLNMNAFNQMFEQTRVPDPDEDGYGDWLKGGEAIEEGKSKKFGKEFNRDVFNKVFESEARRDTGSQLAVRQPEALLATHAVELGRDRPPDYTAPFNSKTGFTDLRNAYTKENTFSGQVAGVRVENRGFEQYKQQYEKQPTAYSVEEAQAIAAWQAQQDAREKQRQLRAAQEHITANEYHERMKRLVLTEK